jgi:hypothetical protein
VQTFGGYDALVQTIVAGFPQSVVFDEPFETRTF